MQRRILIVEDHPTMREAMRLVLEGEGFTIDEAADGERALELVRADPPDLVFLDMNIPGPSGAEVLGELRDDDDPDVGRGRAIAMGADEYFTKPFSPITLLQTVEQVLSSPPHAPEA